jgi:hypothetical protein
MDPQRLHEFFNSVAEVIGEDNVSRHPCSGGLQGPSGSTAYGDPFASPTNHDPSGATRPKNVEEVREIVRLANRFFVALWTVSRGKNLGYVDNARGGYPVCGSLLTCSSLQVRWVCTSSQGNCCAGLAPNGQNSRD